MSIVIREPDASASITLPSAGALAESVVRQGVLPNGIRWAVWPDPRDTVVTLQTWVRVGSAWESRRGTGMAHMLEHLMFRGTHSVPDGEFDARMERLGASVNAATWLDYTMYTCTVAPVGIADAMALEADRFHNLAITETVFQTERSVVANERRQVVEGDPDALLHEELYHLAMKGSSYAWPTIGWADDISAYTRRRIQAFYRQHYIAPHLGVVLVGQITADEAEALVRQHFGHLPAQEPVPAPAPTHFAQPFRRRRQAAVSNSRLLLGWPGPAANAPDYAAWCMFYEVLGGGDASRLPLALEVREELVMDVQTSLAQHRDACVFDVRATLLPDVRIPQVRAAILRVIADLATEGPTDAELAAARIRIRTTDALALSSTSSRAEWMGESWIIHNDFAAGFALADAIGEVRGEDVQAIARRISQTTPWELACTPQRASDDAGDAPELS